MVKPRCVHCGVYSQCRPRKLCYPCSSSKEIRTLYSGSDSKFAKLTASANYNGPAPLPTPTTAKPGTEEKIAVLTERALNLQLLFHPEDAKWEL